MLERRGREERVDHRSYERQGIDREPGEHYGPSAAHVVARGDQHERFDEAVSQADDGEVTRELDAEIARLEALRETILREGIPEEREPEKRDYSHSYRGDVSDGRSWER
jgi:hypothetical protein